MITHYISIITAILGGIVLILGLGSKWLEKTPIPPTLLSLLIGILLGPKGINVFDITQFSEKTLILENAARLTLGIGLVSVALQIPKQFPRQKWPEMLLLIGLSMLFMWAISSLLVYLILGVPLWLAALIGAIITPTDPIASSPIVTGPVAEKNLPDRIRNAISFESGANDGLGFLLVFLPLLMLTKPPQEAISHWLSTILLWELIGATVIGIILGYTAAKLLKVAEKHDFIQKEWRLVYTVALSLLAVGAGKLIKSDEILIVFAASIAFVQIVSEEERGVEKKGQDAADRFFSIPIFALLGNAIPWSGWMELGWQGLFLAAAILLFRRPPVILLLKPFLPSLHHKKDALFMGWFGPVAIAAIYYGSLAEHRLMNPFIWDVVSLVICASVLVHGVSATPLSKLYGKAVRGTKQEE